MIGLNKSEVSFVVFDWVILLYKYFTHNKGNNIIAAGKLPSLCSKEKKMVEFLW